MAVRPVRTLDRGYPSLRYFVGPWLVDLHLPASEALWFGTVLLHHPLSRYPSYVAEFEARRPGSRGRAERADVGTRSAGIVDGLDREGFREADDTVHRMLDEGLASRSAAVGSQLSLERFILEQGADSADVDVIRDRVRMAEGVAALGEMSDAVARVVFVRLFPSWRHSVDELVVTARTLSGL